MKQGYRFTHMELYAKIKEHLEDYKTLAEIIEISGLSKSVTIQKMRLIEDKKLVTSQIIKTDKKHGSTKAYRLCTENLEYKFLG